MAKLCRVLSLRGRSKPNKKTLITEVISVLGLSQTQVGAMAFVSYKYKFLQKKLLLGSTRVLFQTVIQTINPYLDKA
jgi:hypothetical protein